MRASDAIEVKSCPFCGAKVKMVDNMFVRTRMFVCKKCGAEVCFYGAEKAPDAIEHWNTRCERRQEDE